MTVYVLFTQQNPNIPMPGWKKANVFSILSKVKTLLMFSSLKNSRLLSVLTQSLSTLKCCYYV